MKRIIALVLVIALSLCLVGCDLINKIKDKITNEVEEIVIDSAKDESYQSAIDLLNEGKLEEAYAIFKALGDYKDAKEYASRFIYWPSSYEERSNEYKNIWDIKFGENGLPALITATTFDLETSTDLGKATLEFYYDEQNRLIKEVETEGTDTYISEYTYDKNGNVIKEDCTDWNGEKYSHIYEYDENGNTIKSITNHTDGSQTVLIYEYDANSKLIKEDYESTGEYASKYTISYTYDANGNLIKEAEYNDNFNFYITEYTYDVNNNPIKEVTTYSDGSIHTMEYTYDARGNLLKEVSVNSYSDRTIVINYTYDMNNNLTQRTDIFNGVVYYTVSMAYDSNGNVIKYTYTYTDNSGDTEERTEQFTFKLLYVTNDYLREHLNLNTW